MRYNSVWKCWRDWAFQRSVDSQRPTMNHVLLFCLINAGIQFHTMQVYVSALSAYFSIEESRLAESDVVRKFKRACYCQRPPQPKVYPSWSVVRFFDFCRNLMSIELSHSGYTT